ncbi:sigma-70 family RNA polymerase sigma factor [Arenivirga flava]|uniref:Sigma-70 family RNA polymerase sigma factor n=1 Tax=Arenivirga flava TaxID=1930060 RepID=A0AA37UHB9_9MICO|nr:sigma-70 family RNA polymerase sigma factor [Arenivirga flava]GMA28793.1 hypothetical protein GCM10025874_20460 [Arenivirga flava]
MRAAVESSDAELIILARTGDTSALGAIFSRHGTAVTAVARAYSRDPIAADDLAAEAFARTYRVLRSGGGPDVALRAYLYTAVRRLAAERARSKARTRSAGLLDELDRPAPHSDEALDAFEREVVGKAYLALPERWRAVLWHVEVERMSPAAVGPILGLNAAGVSALAYRAREGLRQQYLQQHVARQAGDPACREISELLGAHARGRGARRDRRRVEAHVSGCAPCSRVLAELRDVGHGLRAVVAPLVLGGAATGALPSLVGGDAAAATVASGGGGRVGTADAVGGPSSATAGSPGGASGGPDTVAVGDVPGIANGAAPALHGLGVPAFVLALALGLGGIGVGTWAAVQRIEGPSATGEATSSAGTAADGTTTAGEGSAETPQDGGPGASGPPRLTAAVRTTAALRPGVAGQLLIEFGNAGGAAGEVTARTTLPRGVRLDAGRPLGAEDWTCAEDGDAVECAAQRIDASSAGALSVPVTVASDAPASLPVRVVVHEAGVLAAVDEADAADPASAARR